MIRWGLYWWGGRGRLCGRAHGIGTEVRNLCTAISYGDYIHILRLYRIRATKIQITKTDRRNQTNNATTSDFDYRSSFLLASWTVGPLEHKMRGTRNPKTVQLYSCRRISLPYSLLSACERGVTLATCALPKGVRYLLTYLLLSACERAGFEPREKPGHESLHPVPAHGTVQAKVRAVPCQR